jgi:hypothetical protein
MIKAGKGGHVAAVSSMSGFMATSGCTPYSVAKAGVNALMECYYQALAPYGIGVTLVCPGGIISNIAEASFTRPKELANTGYNINEKTITFMRHHYSFGIQPEDLAKLLKKAIEDEQFLVVPMPDPGPMLRGSFERWVNYASPDCKAKEAERFKKQMEERAKHPMPGLEGAAESGWGRAREDLTWVKPPTRGPGAPQPKKN